MRLRLLSRICVGRFYLCISEGYRVVYYYESLRIMFIIVVWSLAFT
jgi:hypothetical protein